MSKPDSHSGLGQRRTVTLQQQLAFRLLLLPGLELQSRLQQALDDNVMLETDAELDSTWALDVQAGQDPGGPWPRPAQDPLVPPTGPASTLHDYLAWQLELAPIPNGPRAIGRALIEAIDADGLLTRTPESIADSLARNLRADTGVVESVLAIVQQFEPAGVGARSASECVELQLARLDPATPGLEAARKIARLNLDLAAVGSLADLQKLTGCRGVDLECAIALVNSCERRPGAAFRSLRAEYVVADAYARRGSRGWAVDLNPAAVPRLRLNERYVAMITGSPNHASLRAELKEASWLVEGLELRNDLVLRIARTIVERQKGFLENADESLRPLLLRDVADALDLDELTVSRVTAGKYLNTPRGVFEYRFFFTNLIPGSQRDGDTIIRRRAQ